MQELKPEETPRALAYSLFIDAPQPTVTVFKRLDISRLLRFTGRGNRLNTMLCYTAGKAALEIPEFQTRVKNKRLYALEAPFYISFVLKNKAGGLGICAVPICESYGEFCRLYEEKAKALYESCLPMGDEESILLGTSAMTQTVLDGIVNLYSEAFCNPFLSWSRYEKHFFKTTLTVSFQFHHVQMDGGHAAEFLELWQQKILAFRP